MTRNVVFDLDGTLVDSRPGIVGSLMQSAKTVFPGKNIADLHFQIGPPVRAIMQAALGSLSEAQQIALEEAFRASYDNGGWKDTLIYPGVEETLDVLRRQGLSLFIITNKPTFPTTQILVHLDLRHRFEEVLSRDSHQPPFDSKAAMLTFLLAKYSLPAEEALYVGDSEEDLLAAEECKIGFIGIEYGYGTFPERKGQLPMIHSFQELLKVL